MTTIRLAMAGPPKALNAVMTSQELHKKPALLVSYVYFDNFQKCRNDAGFRDYMLDSGAFSAHNSGKNIRLEDYIEFCRNLSLKDSKCKEIVCLDVIGDGVASLRNAERMTAAGLNIVPVYHFGSDIEILKHYLKRYDKIGLGAVVGRSSKAITPFLDKIFSLAWPKKFHGFGMVRKDLLLKYPFHSVDSSSWEYAPTKFGQYKYYGKASIRGSNQPLVGEVRYYLELEERVSHRWAKELRKLDANGTTVRLACVSTRTGSVMNELAKE